MTYRNWKRGSPAIWTRREGILSLYRDTGDLMPTRTPSKRYPGIYQYPVRGGIRWGVLVNLGHDWQTGKRKQKRRQGFRTQEDARAWQIDQQDRTRRGEVVDPSMELFGVVCTRWIDTQYELRDKSLLNLRDRMKHITDRLGPIPISRITTADIDSLYIDLVGRGYAPSYIRSIHGTVRKVLRQSLQHNLIVRDPSEFAKPPVMRKRDAASWTEDEMNRFLTVTKDDPHWGLVWRVFAETWIRVGELTDLRWTAVDLDTAAITIGSTVTLDRNRKRISSTGKTDAARRTIPISSELVSRLRYNRDQQRFRGVTPDLVFPAIRTGGWMPQASVAGALRSACLRVGVPVLTPHGLRHSGGSVAYHRGVDIKTISERLGHTDVRFTMAVYVHSNENQHRQLADKIGAILDGGQHIGNLSEDEKAETGGVTPRLSKGSPTV